MNAYMIILIMFMALFTTAVSNVHSKDKLPEVGEKRVIKDEAVCCNRRGTLDDYDFLKKHGKEQDLIDRKVCKVEGGEKVEVFELYIKYNAILVRRSEGFRKGDPMFCRANATKLLEE